MRGEEGGLQVSQGMGPRSQSGISKRLSDSEARERQMKGMEPRKCTAFLRPVASEGGAVVREKVPEGDWNRLCLIKFRHCLTERNC